ncbi:T9SS type A sorting domain-containing protein [Ekhidna sp.]|uniref:T9SS type A sorting domain-containing protein n=1 Tax=Ekhidna sp. TaxID=2608089 RepID=UPI003296A64E
MKGILVAILFFVAQLGIAQLTIKPIVKPKDNRQGRVSLTRTVNKATLPFWDDFSVTTDSPDSIRIWGNDSTRQWNYELSKNVYVNATLAVNPPSYKVVTFDGLDANGGFHPGSDIGLADELVSDTIDLQGKADVVLSFYWQAGGNVEIPEEGDSLRLQFYDPNTSPNQWITVWKKDGGELASDQDSVFTQEAINVSSRFLTQKFLFRFQSFGDKDGPFDAWHLDWIYLDENRASDNYYYLDRGLTGQLTSPLSPYKSMPLSQFKANESAFSSSQMVQAFNLDEQLQPTEYILVIRNENNGSRIDSVEYGAEDPLFSNPNPFKITNTRFINLDGLDLSSLPNEDSVVISSKVYLESSDDDFLNGTAVDLKINDTLRAEYLLHNYYAYDDGTAEYAVGTNINGAQVAVRFLLEQEDTLTHIDIHFPNIDPISAGSLLELRIFKNLTDEPIKTMDVTVVNATRLNEFTRYQLSGSLLLADTFYIGYEQSKNDYIGIGFDRSNPAASEFIYENKTGEWEQNVRLVGALMIRPVFASIDSIVLSTENEALTFKTYPNPTTGLIQIEGAYHSITLIDFAGRTWVKEAYKRTHDFSSLKAGLYLLTIHRKEGDQTLKIIKK